MNPGALVGAMGATGLWLLTCHLAARRPRLEPRLAPYLRPASSPTTSAPVLARLFAPVLHDAVRVVERFGSPGEVVQRRLARAGRDVSLEEYRIEQVVAGLLGAGAGLTVSLLLLAGRGMHPLVGALLTLVGGCAALVLQDQALSRRTRRREGRLLAELPAVAELLALAVAAGEGALGALERVSRSTQGELSREVRAALADTRAGTPLAVALERMADRTGLVSLARFAEAIAVAVERGTPLAEVLRAQAGDVREDGRRALMETAGRKEIAMMIPVVFLVLPVTVLFAIFPGLSVLRLDL